MRLATITTLGCDRLPDRSFELGAAGAAPSDLVVVTGPPASGKSSLLELIVTVKEDCGPYGPPPWLDPWRKREEAAAKIVAEWVLDEQELVEVGGLPRRPFETIIDPKRLPEADLDPDDGLRRVLSRLSPDHPKVEWFHPGRRIPPPAAFIGSGTLDAERHHRLQSTNQKYATLHAFLVELALGMHEPDGLPNKPGSRAMLFDDIVRELTNSTLGFAGSTRGTSPAPLFLRRDGTVRELHQLSHSEEQLVLFAGTIVRSRLERSVILLDGPEQMVGAARGAHVVQVLRKHTPGAQWIVATDLDVAAKLGASRTIEMKG